MSVGDTEQAQVGGYQTRQVVVDDIGGTQEELMDAIDRTITEFDEGSIVEGTVVRVDKDEVLLDIGYKSEGVIPARELSIRQDIDPGDVVTVGERIEALVLQKEDKEGRLILSKKRAQYERAWGKIEELKDRGEMVKGPVIEVVKGGLILDIGLRGFLPASLVELRRVRDLHPYVGKELECKIIELDKNRNNVVLSRRAYLEETQKDQREQFLENLKPGEVRTGVVSSVVNFGAFVDLGGMDGLIHVSELSWKHVDNPASVVQVGDEVTVKVLDVDYDRERISLSLKATQRDPWEVFASESGIGDDVEGVVTKLVPFGAFVQVAEGIEGLVHISEMAEHHVEFPEQVVRPGDKVTVRIIDIDLQRRRISLSIKQTGVAPPGYEPEPQEQLEEPPAYSSTSESYEQAAGSGLSPEAEAILQRLRSQVQGDLSEAPPPEDRSFGEQVAEVAAAEEQAPAAEEQAPAAEEPAPTAAPAEAPSPSTDGEAGEGDGDKTWQEVVADIKQEGIAPSPQ